MSTTSSIALKTTIKSASKPASKTAVTKDVQKLQRAIVDGLEDVKAQDIVVFDTEHLSSLFERVVVASGTSNFFALHPRFCKTSGGGRRKRRMDHCGLRPGRGACDAAQHPHVLQPRRALGRKASAPEAGCRQAAGCTFCQSRTRASRCQISG